MSDVSDRQNAALRGRYKIERELEGRVNRCVNVSGGGFPLLG